MPVSRRVLFTIAAVFGLLAVLIAPDRLASVGLMDISLGHENPLVRRTAEVEIALARWICAAVAALALAGALAYERILGSKAYRRLMERPPAPPAGYDRALSRVATPSLAVMAALYLLVVAYLAFGERLFSLELLVAMNLEDGAIETASALLLLLAALLAGSVALAIRARLPRYAVMHGLLAVLFFLMFGEEISWGQRYLGLETPEALRQLNVQEEINLHNMFGYAFDHLFILFFFLWGVVAPMLRAVSPGFRQLFRAIGLPIPGAGLALGMLAVSLFQDQIVYQFTDGLPALRMPELRELMSAMAFLLLMVESRRHLAGNASPARARGAAVQRGGASVR